MIVGTIHTSCPFCGYQTDSVVPHDGRDFRMPEAGDISVCIDCLHIAVYDDTEGMHLRKPTPSEQLEIESDVPLMKYISGERTRRHAVEVKKN